MHGPTGSLMEEKWRRIRSEDKNIPIPELFEDNTNYA